MPGYSCWTKHGEDQILQEDTAGMDEDNESHEHVNNMPLEQAHDKCRPVEEGTNMDDDSSQNGNELDQMLYDAEDNFEDNHAYSKFVALLED